MFNYTKYFAMLHSTLNKNSNGFMIPSSKMTLDHDSSNVIEIRDAYMRYTQNNVVFQGLNMTVKKGTIYGLLGPSGCGKTTVLNCITGISTLDTGTIYVRCTDRRQIGYMPQEVALMEKFKISELLHYFGKVYGIDYDKVEKRAKDLLLLVDLPPNEFYHLYVTSLSGGQLRRVSLLVALIHDPDLLILDEPTVGLDPITRFSLWEYFLKETEQRHKTILITTHYIEEARQSHTIGLMRGGVLLAEAPPEKLLVDYKCPSLEDVFLLLSHNQAESSSEIKPYPTVKTSPAAFSSTNSYCSLNRLVAQTQKNFYWVKRNPWMMLYVLLLPGMMSFLFCTVYTNDIKGLRIGIVPEELCTNYTTTLEPRCDKDYKLSCLYSQYMKNKGFIVNEYSDLSSGMNDLRRGHSLALLFFNNNYTSALLDFFSSSIAVPPEDETFNNCELQVTLDMTEMLKAAQIKLATKEVFNDIKTDLEKSCGYDSRLWMNPIRSQVVYGSDQIDFTHNAIPGFIIPVVFYLTTTYTSTAAISERSTGVFRRSLVSGLTKLEMNLSHAVMQVIVASAQNCLVMVMMYVIFPNPMEGSVLTALAFIYMAEMQGMLYALFLASVFKKETNLTNTAIGTVLSLFLTSGMVWPIEGMMPGLRQIVDYSPWASAVQAYRNISIRGWGLDNPDVLSALWYNVAVVAIMVAINIVSAKINRNC